MFFKALFQNASAHIQLVTRGMNDAMLSWWFLNWRIFANEHGVFSKKHLETVYVLQAYTGIAEPCPVEKANLNQLTDPVPAQVKSLDPPFIQSRWLQSCSQIPHACQCNVELWLYWKRFNADLFLHPARAPWGSRALWALSAEKSMEATRSLQGICRAASGGTSGNAWPRAPSSPYALEILPNRKPSGVWKISARSSCEWGEQFKQLNSLEATVTLFMKREIRQSVPAHLIRSCAYIIQASCTVGYICRSFGYTIQILYLHGMSVGSTDCS